MPRTPASEQHFGLFISSFDFAVVLLEDQPASQPANRAVPRVLNIYLPRTRTERMRVGGREKKTHAASVSYMDTRTMATDLRGARHKRRSIATYIRRRVAYISPDTTISFGRQSQIYCALSKKVKQRFLSLLIRKSLQIPPQPGIFKSNLFLDKGNYTAICPETQKTGEQNHNSSTDFPRSSPMIVVKSFQRHPSIAHPRKNKTSKTRLGTRIPISALHPTPMMSKLHR